MIQFAHHNTAILVREMWKECFRDSDEFLDIHFSFKYKNENTLIYFEDGKAVASLQMLPYTINFYHQEIPFSYLAGLCTLPEYRNRGYMDKLIKEAHKVIANRNIPLSILIPAEDSLYQFYHRYDYEQVFEKDNHPIPLKEILDRHSDLEDAYQEFDALYRKKDFCVQKNMTDFKAVALDYALGGYPLRTDLSAMAKVIDPFLLLSLYAKNNTHKEFVVKVDNFGIYSVKRGQVLVDTEDTLFDFSVDSRLLCRLLFGFKINHLDPFFLSYFSKHHPIINLMME